MIRKIIKINEALCNGCGLCAKACHEGAIDMVNGKAKLAREHYCDGLGDCLPACPTGAITFEEREAPAYDEAAVKAAQAAKKAAGNNPEEKTENRSHQTASSGFPPSGGCPGSMSRMLRRMPASPQASPSPSGPSFCESQLSQWPVQIKLAPLEAPYFDNANLLIAADCTAYAYGNFHQDFIRNRVTLIGCPKLDEGDYTEKLTEILSRNQIKSLTIARMQVPCCGGIERAAVNALKASGKFIPWQVRVITPDGQIVE